MRRNKKRRVLKIQVNKEPTLNQTDESLETQVAFIIGFERVVGKLGRIALGYLILDTARQMLLIKANKK